MFNLFKKREKENVINEIRKSDLRDFSQKFRNNNRLDYTESQYLFDNAGFFNKKNYNSGVDLLLRRYLGNIAYSPKLETHYAFSQEDIFALSVSVDCFTNDKIVAIIYISFFNSHMKDNDIRIYHIEYFKNSRKVEKMYCNNQTCTEDQYMFLLNFIQKYSLYTGFFGKTHIGYKIDLENVKYNYSDIL